MSTVHYLTIDSVDDFGSGVYKVTDLRKMLRKIVRKHGKNAHVVFDAGYNNISLDVVRVRRPRRKR